MYPDNSLHGNALVLAHYAELTNPDFPPTIPGRLQAWLDERIDGSTSRPGVPTFVWGSAERIRRRRAGLRGVIPMGAPWLYLLDLEAKARLPRAPRRPWEAIMMPTPQRHLYFPHHGLGGALAARDHARSHAHLVNDGGLTVALTHEQAAAGDTRAAYEDVGALVVDLGLVQDEVGPVTDCHLVRLLDLMRTHARVLTDRPSAYSLFAHAAGIPVQAHAPTDLVVDATRRELGTDVLLAPQELRAIFDWNTHV